jgi:hypothetical protein
VTWLDLEILFLLLVYGIMETVENEPNCCGSQRMDGE